MLTVLPTRDTISSGALESNAFTIKANGKAFKVLIDGLYSDKIRAVVRELWSNAFDSHVEAGRADIPFDCHIPSLYEPHFSVRDYGVSLSHQGVMKLYTTVFESSKEGTNATVGKLGLGSKSPFAYTDVFTVTAWKDGVKRMYSAYIGSNYVPTIDFLGEEPSDEPQGLEISFPVKSSDDTTDFRLAAQRVANGFDVLPNCGDFRLTKTTAEALFEGPGWKLYRTSDYGHSAHARQGCVIYPIDANAVVGLNETQRSLLRAPIYIDFPIGELEISASRESLGYDAPTCANITKRLDAIEADIMAQFQSKFDAIKTMWEALVFRKELDSLHLPECVKTIIKKFQFKGRVVPGSLYLDWKQYRRCGISRYQTIYRRGRNKLEEANHTAHLTPGEFQVFTIGKDEVVSAMLARIQQWRDTNYHVKNVFILRANEGSVAWRRAIALFGRMPSSDWLKISDLPKPEKDSTYVKKPVKARKLVNNAMHECEVDLNGGGIYVVMERGDIKDKPEGREFSSTQVKNIAEALRSLGVLGQDEVVYGIPASLKRAYQRDGSGWVNLFEIAQKTIDDNAAKYADIGRLSELNSFFDSNGSALFSMVKALLKGGTILSSALTNGRFATYYRVIEKLWHERIALKAVKRNDYMVLVNTLGVPVVGKSVSQQYTRVVPFVMRDYPMMQLFEKLSYHRDLNHDDAMTALDYVTLVDTK